MRLASLSAILVLVACPMFRAAEAATFTTPHRSEYHTGVIYGGNLSGFVTLAKGETVTDVRMFYNNSHGYAGQIVGTYNANTGAWTASVAAFDTVSYYAQVTTTINGRKYYYDSQLYYWGY